MNKPFFSIKNDLGTPVISITGEIGYEVDYGMFRNAVIDLVSKGFKRVKLVINSVGGDMVEGFAMYDFIKSLNLIVEVQIIGMAASMAGVLSQCATGGLLGMTENALVMTHRPQSRSFGESDQHRTNADISDKLEEKAKAVYKSRGVKSDPMTDWFKPGQMKWFTAEEALAAGIVDYIIKSDNSIKAKLEKPMASFKEETSAFKYYNSIFTNNKPSMNKLLYAAVLLLNSNGVTNVNVDSSEDDVIKALNAFDAAQKTKITTLNNLVGDAAKTRAKDLVSSFKALGKLPADMKPEDEAKYVEQATQNPEMFNSMMALVPGAKSEAQAPVNHIDFNKELNKNSNSNANGIQNTLPADKKNWNIRQWEENDPDGLKNILVNNRAEYHKLFKAFYNSEPFTL